MKKDIVGFEDLYEITDDARIFNKKTGRELKQPIHYSNGYKKVTLSKDGKPYYFRVHRLVAQAFVPNYNEDECTQVDHIDGDKLNNNASNLRWVSNSQNMKAKKDMSNARKKFPIKINGTVYDSTYAAAKYIASCEPGKKASTINRELRRFILGERKSWTMYGKYEIDYV